MELEWKSSPFEGYAHRWVRDNLWRVRHSLGDYNDAVQECAVQFAYVRYKYPHVDKPAWMMSLYMLAISQRWTDLARRDSNIREYVPDPLDEIEYSTTGLVDVWHSASVELRQVLCIFATATPRFLNALLVDVNDGARLNTRIKRLCSIKCDSDLVDELRYLLNAPELPELEAATL